MKKTYLPEGLKINLSRLGERREVPKVEGTKAIWQEYNKKNAGLAFSLTNNNRFFWGKNCSSPEGDTSSSKRGTSFARLRAGSDSESQVRWGASLKGKSNCHSELVSESVSKKMLKQVQHDRGKNCSSPEGEVRWGASHAAFTLIEVLLACVIVGVISALVLPVFVSKYRQKSFDLGFERQIKSLNNAIDALAITENKDYFKTVMYTSDEPESYLDNSGQFIKKYLKLSKYCGDSNRDCFANIYYKYENKDKSVYNPEFKGACGSLKNGSSICLTPQIGVGVNAIPPKVLIDINGKKGPNVLGQDLRTFTLNLKTRTALNTTTQKVETTEASYEINNTLNCQRNPRSLSCCEYQGITDSNASYCCDYDELQNSEACCRIGINDSNSGYCCAQAEFANSEICCNHRGITGPDDICCNYTSIKAANFAKCDYCTNLAGQRGANVSGLGNYAYSSEVGGCIYNMGGDYRGIHVFLNGQSPGSGGLVDVCGERGLINLSLADILQIDKLDLPLSLSDNKVWSTLEHGSTVLDSGCPYVEFGKDWRNYAYTGCGTYHTVLCILK